MKLAVILSATLLCVLARPVHAQPATDCAQTMNQVESLAAAIDRDARAYWAYRSAYVALSTKPPAAKKPDAPKLAQQAEASAAPVQARAPASYANLRVLLEKAKKQGCATPAKLAALREAAFKSSQRVRFDRFPEEEAREASSAPLLRTTNLPTLKAR